MLCPVTSSCNERQSFEQIMIMSIRVRLARYRRSYFRKKLILLKNSLASETDNDSSFVQ